MVIALWCRMFGHDWREYHNIHIARSYQEHGTRCARCGRWWNGES